MKNKRLQKLRQIKEEHEKYGMKQVRCISDEILLYVRYIVNETAFHDTEMDEEFRAEAERIYKLIRGGDFSGLMPSAIASAICYLARRNCGSNFTLLHFEEQLQITSGSIRRAVRYIKYSLNL